MVLWFPSFLRFQGGGAGKSCERHDQHLPMYQVSQCMVSVSTTEDMAHAYGVTDIIVAFDAQIGGAL